jgi:hypothetical protein
MTMCLPYARLETRPSRTPAQLRDDGLLAASARQVATSTSRTSPSVSSSSRPQRYSCTASSAASGDKVRSHQLAAHAPLVGCSGMSGGHVSNHRGRGTTGCQSPSHDRRVLPPECSVERGETFNGHDGPNEAPTPGQPLQENRKEPRSGVIGGQHAFPDLEHSNAICGRIGNRLVTDASDNSTVALPNHAEHRRASRDALRGDDLDEIRRQSQCNPGRESAHPPGQLRFVCHDKHDSGRPLDVSASAAAAQDRIGRRRLQAVGSPGDLGPTMGWSRLPRRFSPTRCASSQTCVPTSQRNCSPASTAVGCNAVLGGLTWLPRIGGPVVPVA